MICFIQFKLQAVKEETWFWGITSSLSLSKPSHQFVYFFEDEAFKNGICWFILKFTNFNPWAKFILVQVISVWNCSVVLPLLFCDVGVSKWEWFITLTIFHVLCRHESPHFKCCINFKLWQKKLHQIASFVRTRCVVKCF